MLQEPFFTKLVSENINGYTYDGYIAKFRPIILYSKETSEPLASLSVMFNNEQDYKNYGCGIVEMNNELHDKLELQRFQILATKNNTEISFVVTNLTSSTINFNLFVSNNIDEYLVDNIIPDCINQVNCLNKYDSYVVKCDNTNENRTIIIKEQFTETGENIKLGDELKHETSKQVMHIYPKIIPEKTNESNEKFKNSIWKVADHVIIKKKNKVVIPTNNFKKQLDRISMEEKLDDKIIENMDRIIERWERLENLTSATEDLSASCEFYRRDIMKSNIAIIEHGNKVEVHSRQINLELDIENQSNNMKLGMSVMENYTLNSERTVEQITIDIQNYIKNCSV